MKKICLIIAVALLGFPLIAMAANTGWKSSVGNLAGYVGGTGLESDLASPIGTMIQMALVLVGMIFLTLTVYAGFLWMTASGNETKVEKAQKILVAAVIGLVIVSSAYAITYFITKTLGASSGNSNNGTSAYCSEKKGTCIGVDDSCPGGTVVSGFTDCRCCIVNNEDTFWK